VGTITRMKEQQKGSEAHDKGSPRYANPHLALQARAWTYGWNVAHGVCRGCEKCNNGTQEMPETLGRYLKTHPPSRQSSIPVTAGNRAFEGN
jgi:hypothetical protein